MAAVAVLTRRMLAERRRTLASVSIGGALVVIATAALYASLGDQYATITEGLPEAVLNLFGGGDLATPAGYLESELLSFVAPGLVLGVAIAVGSGSLAGSERAGHLALVFTAPVSRTRVALASLAATTIAVVVVTIALWAGLMIGDPLGSLHISTGRLVAASVMLGLLGIAGGALAFGIGAATGARTAAAGATTAVLVASYLIYALTPLSESTNGLRYVSLWYPYAANHPLVDGISVAHVLVLVALAVIFATAGGALLQRRDVEG